MENKTGKYLKYAIGEIVLVVVGILIALQINNWNENKKNNVKEKELLIALSSDFQETKNRLKETISYQSRTNNLTRKLITYYITNELENHTDSIPELATRGAQSFWIAEPVTRTYETLISTGSIDLLKNENLKINLAEYYAELNSGFEDHNPSMDLLENISNRMAPYKFHLKFDKFRKFVGLLPINPIEKGSLFSIHNANKLQNEHALFNLITMRLMYEVNRLTRQNKMLIFTEEILIEIQNDLDN